jgi:hypothetical protein
MVDRRLHDDLRKIYLDLKAPRFDLHRQPEPPHCSRLGRGLRQQPNRRLSRLSCPTAAARTT